MLLQKLLKKISQNIIFADIINRYFSYIHRNILIQSIVIIAIIIINLCSQNVRANECNVNLDYKIYERIDGGYEIKIVCTKRINKLITAEGFFPKVTKRFEIIITGEGIDWEERRNQDGYYYSSDQIFCDTEAWDLGYAWVDKNRENIYLNFYWISSPDSLKPSMINGKYKISTSQ